MGSVVPPVAGLGLLGHNGPFDLGPLPSGATPPWTDATQEPEIVQGLAACFGATLSLLGSPLRASSELRPPGKMTPSNSDAPEFEGTSPNRRGPSDPADWLSPTEIYKAGNLTVFASDRQHPDRPVLLDFHFTRGSQGASHWHGLLQGRTLFLDTPRLALDFNSRESLTATLEYIEENTGAEQVLVNFRKARRDRGNLLRAFSFLGFELVTPDHPGLPPWEDTIFMAYPLERDLGWNPPPKQE